MTIQHFIEQVIGNCETVKQDIESLQQKFVDSVIEANDDPVVRHLAKCFGHIYAAAVIGVRLGTLPWSTKLVRKCIMRCYRDARRELNTETDLLRDGLNILRRKISRLAEGQWC